MSASALAATFACTASSSLQHVRVAWLDNCMYLVADPSGAPFVLVPSFDSSVLEFRRLLPLLEARRRTWAIDLVGWGFTDVSFGIDGDAPLGPVQKREHLFAFWKEQVRLQPFLLC